MRFVDRHPLEPAKRHNLRCATRLDDLTLRIERVDRHVGPHRPAEHQTGQDTPQEIVAIEQRDQKLERPIGIGRRRGDMRNDSFEQRRQRPFAAIRIQAGIAIAAAGKKHGKIKLFISRIQRHEQVEHFVEHFLNPLVGPVDLVHDDNRTQAERKRLAGHELGLRHCAFGSVYKQNHPINHAQDALDLTAEIGVAGRIDNVDPRIDALPMPFDAGAFRQNRDPTFFL